MHPGHKSTFLFYNCHVLFRRSTLSQEYNGFNLDSAQQSFALTLDDLGLAVKLLAAIDMGRREEIKSEKVN